MNPYKPMLDEQQRFFYTGKTKSIGFRLAMLKRLREAIVDYEDDIAEALYKDLGKSQHEAVMTEIGFTLAEIKTVMKGLKRWSKPKVKGTNLANVGTASFTVREPYGLTLIIGPWNYPFQLLIAPLVGAIAGGNCAVLKPSELTPHTAQVVEKMISGIFRPHYIKVEQGGIPETENLLELRYDKIFFTGSPMVGKIIMERASKHLTPVVLELGGKSPAIIEKSANLKMAAKRIVFGKGVNSGQTCVAPDYVLIHESVKEDFIDEFRKAVRTLYGDDLQNNPDYGRILNEKNYNRIKSYLEGQNIIMGGHMDDEDLHMDLTLVEVTDMGAPIMQDEIFGPILPVVTYRDYSNILDIVRMNPDPLACYIFSRNQKFVKRIIKDVPFGGGCVNDTIMHLSNDYLPFGGRGTSGMGNYHGKHSLDAFTHEKAVLMSHSGLDLPLRYPPFKKGTLDLIKKIMY